MKIITAIGNPNLNEELKKEEGFEIIGRDIQYQEGIIEILENNKEINILIMSELILENINLIKLINNIKNINNKIKIIIILEQENEELKNKLIDIGIINIFYNNKTEITEIINVIKTERNNNTEEIKNELKMLKEIILKKEIKVVEKEKGEKVNNREVKKAKIISVLGTGGVGKSIVSTNLANILKISKNKILIIDFDILNNSIHTILGVNKYSKKVNKKIKQNNAINNINILDMINKINKKVDLISGIDLLFDSKYNINSDKIDIIIKQLKSIYDLIIIDTSSECLFDYTKVLIYHSDICIFLIEPNLIEIKKSKNLLNIYLNEWNINKDKINIIFNKYNTNSVDKKILKSIFSEFNILGKINFSKKYSLIINKNIKSKYLDKSIKSEYRKISNKIANTKRQKKSMHIKAADFIKSGIKKYL